MKTEFEILKDHIANDNGFYGIELHVVNSKRALCKNYEYMTYTATDGKPVYIHEGSGGLLFAGRSYWFGEKFTISGLLSTWKPTALAEEEQEYEEIDDLKELDELADMYL